MRSDAGAQSLAADTRAQIFAIKYWQYTKKFNNKILKPYDRSTTGEILALDVNGFDRQLHLSRFKAGQPVQELSELLGPEGRQCLIP